MKKFKSTWILFSVVVGVTAYTYFSEFYKKEQDETRKSEDSKVFQLNKDQINQVIVHNASGSTILDRSVDGWSLGAPMKDSADNDSVENFIGELTGEKTKELAKESESLDFNPFGFGPDSARVTLKNTAGVTEEVEISNQKNFENFPFVKIKGKENKVFVGNTTWLGHAAHSAFDFRDKRIFRARIADAEEFEARNSLGSVKLVIKDGKWMDPTKVDLVLDQNRVREILAAVADLKAQAIVSEDAKEKNKFGFQSPEITLKIKLKDKTWVAEFVPAKESAHVLNSFPGLISRIDKESFARFNQLSLLGLRDHHLPFAYDKNPVQKIEYGSTLKTSRLVLKEGQWMLPEPDPTLEVQQGAVKDLVDRLKTLEATHYLPSSETRSFKAENKIRLADAEDKTLFEFLWSPVLKKKINGIEKNLHLAKTSVSSEIFALDEGSLSRLNLQSLTKKKETP